MLTRFDHVVIAVHDVAEATRIYRALGFSVRPGGRHPGHGTENAIVRFGLDYLELLAVVDSDEAHTGGLDAPALQEFLRRRPGGIVGYALASDDIDGDAARVRAFGLPVEGPFSMRRVRPDGSVLSWKLAVPGTTPWRRPWPFLIQWDTPDAERLADEHIVQQPNSVTGISSLTVALTDLEATVNLYQSGLGLALTERHSNAAEFTLGSVRLQLQTPQPGDSDGTVARALHANGEGVFRVALDIADLKSLRDLPDTSGDLFSTPAGLVFELHVSPQSTPEAQLLLSNRADQH